jgi:hypothetical protein
MWALVLACAAPPQTLDAAHPWSFRLGASRYLEATDAQIAWLADEGIPARAVGRTSFDEGTWYEVHVGAGATPESLSELDDALHELGFVAPELRDWREWGDQAQTDLSDYQRYTYDPELTQVQVGPALHAISELQPCHPRLGLRSFAAAQLTRHNNELVDQALLPADLHAVVADLAQADPQNPIVSQGVWVDLPTGVELGVSMVWRAPLEDPALLGEPVWELGDWLGRPIAEPGASWQGAEVVALLWTPGAERVALVTATDPAGYALVETLFDASYCQGGAFHYASLWRPLAVLPTSFGQDEVPVALATEILGEAYIASKGDAAWARRLDGRWQYSQHHLSEGVHLWGAAVFDLASREEARSVHTGLYSDSLRGGYGSYYNRLAKAYRMDAVYKTRVRGVPAWYLDFFQTRRSKELNFTEGPFIFAFNSYVYDPEPLLMDDMVDRAEQLPILGGTPR